MQESIPSLVSVFEQVRDWRAARGKRYGLGTVLSVAFLAILSGENSLQGIASWVQEQRWSLSAALHLKGHRVPGYETIRTVMRDLDIVAFEGQLQTWANRVAAAYQIKEWPGLSVDGKTLRGSRDGEQAAVHLLSAFRQELEVVVAQQAVDGKTNEIPVARDLLQMLTLDGLLITCDALHTQRDTAALIVEKGGPIGWSPMITNRP
jgi:hypothetical protein